MTTKAVHLRTDYRIDPLGLDNTTPRLSWSCEGGVKQHAFRVIASEESGSTVFDSGTVESDRMNCRYAGNPLKSGQTIRWNVTLWDGESEETSEDASDGGHGYFPGGIYTYEKTFTAPTEWEG